MSPWFDEHGRLRAGWRFLVAVIVVIIANTLAGDLAASVVGDRSERLFDLVYRPLGAALLLASFSLLLMVADRVRGNPLAAMGLGRKRWLSQFLLGCAIAAGMICAAVCGIAIGGHLDFSFTLNVRTAELTLVELTILITGALLEELMFRGYPFQRLVDSVGSAGAVVIGSAFFGLVHLGNPYSSPWALVNTIVVGVLISVAYLRTRALWLPWGIHFAWNTTLGMAFGLPVSGLTQFAVVVKGSAQGPRWLTGGAYGIEASALGTLVILLGFVPLLLATRHHEPQAPADAVALEQTAPSDQPPLRRIQP